jgi:hypothetical protein
MLDDDPMDRTIAALVLAGVAVLWPAAAAGSEPESKRGGRLSTPLGLAVECEAPCPPVSASRDEFGSLGLRLSETQLRLPTKTTTEAGVLLAMNHHQYVSMGHSSLRLRDFAFLGGGSAGLEGGLGGDWAFGWRAPLTDQQGPFARLGIRAQLLGNDAFYGSALELPVGHVGYQLLRDRELLFEFAFTIAPMLVGRYNVDGGSPRRLGGSFDHGGHLALRLQAIHLEASYVRAVPGDDSPFSAVNWFTLELCGGARPVAVCFDARHVSGDVTAASGDGVVRALTWYLGAHFSLSTEPGRAARRKRASHGS